MKKFILKFLYLMHRYYDKGSTKSIAPYVIFFAMLTNHVHGQNTSIGVKVDSCLLKRYERRVMKSYQKSSCAEKNVTPQQTHIFYVPVPKNFNLENLQNEDSLKKLEVRKIKYRLKKYLSTITTTIHTQDTIILGSSDGVIIMCIEDYKNTVFDDDREFLEFVREKNIKQSIAINNVSMPTYFCFSENNEVFVFSLRGKDNYQVFTLHDFISTTYEDEQTRKYKKQHQLK